MISTGFLQRAKIEDLKEICRFTDFWLAGRGKKIGACGATNDCFISPSQHKKYIEKYATWIIKEEEKIIAWSVTQHDGSLIHFLIAGTHRGKNIGSTFLDALSPAQIHSKSNQQSGNPGPFYEKHGYIKTESRQSKSRLDIDKIKPNRKKTIDIYVKTKESEEEKTCKAS